MACLLILLIGVYFLSPQLECMLCEMRDCALFVAAWHVVFTKLQGGRKEGMDGLAFWSIYHVLLLWLILVYS